MKQDIPVNSSCYRELEEAARRCTLRPVRLNGRDRQALGLLLLEEGVSDRELKKALDGLELGPRSCGGADQSGALGSTDRMEFDALLALELERTRKTRLPCALLLLGIKGRRAAPRPSLADQAAAMLSPCLHPPDILAALETETLALILPGVNICKARKRAEEILAALGNLSRAMTGKVASPCLALGIAVCHAYDSISADQLLAVARAELERAVGVGPNSICHAAVRWQDDSCQVTVEERAQLFSFLQKEACS